MPDNALPPALVSHRNLWYVGTGLTVVVVVALLAFGPGESTPCLIYSATGVSCPGCGMTRAAAAMLRGDWSAMWRLHPLAPVIALQGLVIWALWGWQVLVRKRAVREAPLLVLLCANTLFLAGVWLVRLVLGTLP